MKEIFQEVLKQTPIFFVIIGVIVFLLGVTDGVTIQSFSVKIVTLSAKILTVILGGIFITVGIYLSLQKTIVFSMNIEVFDRTSQLWEYVEKRIGEAKSTIDDLTWTPGEPERTEQARQKYENYKKAVDKACAKPEICYREVMSFPPFSHITRAKEMLEKNYVGYNLRFYEFSHIEIPPLLSFMIIDGKEVIFGFYRTPYLSEEKTIHLTVKHPEIVKLFQDYYETIWQGAKKIKDGSTVYAQEFEEIEKRLTLDKI